MTKPISARQEKFAQFVASGDTLSAAYKKAGYSGNPRRCSSTIAANFAVAQRINELHQNLEKRLDMKREDLAHWLIAAILTPPNEIDGDSPLAQEVFTEIRPFGKGASNRKRIKVRVKMVSKLDAVKQLADLFGWDQPVKIQVEGRSGLLADIEERAKLLVSALDRVAIPTQGRIIEARPEPDLLSPPVTTEA
jgi:phage terminase small subunit